MPTGYTADVVDGTQRNVKDFLGNCARAFGAFMHQRDESTGPARLPEVSTPYELKALARAKGELEVLLGWSAGRIQKEHKTYTSETRKQNQELRGEWSQKRGRITAMLNKVNAWEPNDQAAPVKRFALEQLTMTMDSDCGDVPFQLTINEDAQAWYDGKVDDAREDVAYYEVKAEEAIKRQTNNIAYAKAVLDSIDAI